MDRRSSLRLGAAGAALCALFSSVPAKGVDILMLTCTNSSVDAQLKTLFEGAGHIVTIGPRYGAYDGTGVDQYDVVIAMDSYGVGGGTMPLAGQESLRDFVQAGGGLITGEWIIWGNYGELPVLHHVLPVEPSYGYRAAGTITYSISTADPILSAALPDNFSFPADVIDGGTETAFHPKPGATVYFGSDYPGGEGVIGRCSCAGRTLSFSTLISASEVADPEYTQLLLNGVAWVVQDVPPCAGDFNCDGLRDQSDLGTLLASYNIDDGGDIDGDGDTDQADLGALLAEYGEPCM